MTTVRYDGITHNFMMLNRCEVRRSTDQRARWRPGGFEHIADARSFHRGKRTHTDQGGLMMVRSWYFYSLTPVVLVFGTAVLLTIPYLAVVALLIVGILVLAALVWVAVMAPLALIRVVRRHWPNHRAAYATPTALYTTATGVRRPVE